VGNELRGRVACLAVVRVVVALPGLDVVGEGPGYRIAGVAVAGHQVGDVVAHHAAEPAELVAHVRVVVADVGGRGDADGQRRGVPACRCRGLPGGTDRPPGDVRVGALQDEAVGLLAAHLQRLRPVGRHPHLQAAIPYPRDLDLRPGEVDLPALGQVPDDV